jgi:hypothetical protein
MLNWLKNRTFQDWANAPIVNDGETIIDASAAAIFDKLDLASPRNALRERGFAFGDGNPAYDIFEASAPDLPDTPLVFEVTESRPNKRYCYRTTPRAWSEGVAVLESASEFTIIPQKDGRHLLHLQETCLLAPRLNRDQYVLERAKLSFSVFRTLARLRLNLESGVDLKSLG